MSPPRQHSSGGITPAQKEKLQIQNVLRWQKFVIFFYYHCHHHHQGHIASGSELAGKCNSDDCHVVIHGYIYCSVVTHEYISKPVSRIVSSQPNLHNACENTVKELDSSLNSAHCSCVTSRKNTHMCMCAPFLVPGVRDENVPL